MTVLTTKKQHPSQLPGYQFPTTEERKREMPLAEDGYPRKVNWGLLRGGYELVDLQTAPHFLLVGNTRSGKTTLLKLLQTSALKSQSNRFQLRYRALINDPKTDLIPMLGQFGLDVNRDVIIANPFDKRSSAWGMWLDVKSDVEVKTLAEVCCPLETSQTQRDESRFFDIVANAFLLAVIKGLIVRSNGRYWDLRDIVCCCDDKNAFYEILKTTHEGQVALHRYLRVDSRLSHNSYASLAAPLSRLRTTAALWDRAETFFSVKDWRKKGAILLLGYKLAAKDVTQLPNFMVLRSAIQTVLDQPGDNYLIDDELSWFFLDEISSIGETPGLLDALNMGAGKGIRVVITELGFTSLETSFPNKTWNQVINACRNIAVLNLTNPEDQQIAANLFGMRPFPKTNDNWPHDGSSGSTSIHEQRDYLVPPEEFGQLPLAGSNGVTAHFLTEHGPIFPDNQTTMNGPEILAALPTESSLPEALVSRDDSDQELRPWTASDRARFGLRSKPARESLFDDLPTGQDDDDEPDIRLDV